MLLPLLALSNMKNLDSVRRNFVFWGHECSTRGDYAYSILKKSFQNASSAVVVFFPVLINTG